MKCKIIIGTFIIAILVILVPSVMSVTSAHEENLYVVTEKRITEAAILCVKEENCNDEVIYLKDLYNLSYLENEYDPVTKEYYNEYSFVRFEDGKVEFVVVS